MTLQLIEKLMVKSIEEFIVVRVDLSEFFSLEEGTFDVGLGVPGRFDTFTPCVASASRGEVSLMQRRLDAGPSDGRDELSLIHISEPPRRYAISYAVFCLKKKKKKKKACTSWPGFSCCIG